MGAPLAPSGEFAEEVAPGVDGELAQLERELTREVPSLLEALGRASDEAGLCERRAGEARRRHEALLEQRAACYEDLRARHGAAVDAVRPYFDAAQVLNAASHRVQGATRELCAASSEQLRAEAELRQVEHRLQLGAHRVELQPEQQDGLLCATARVLRCKQERGGRERERARALREQEEAQEALEAWRAQIGDAGRAAVAVGPPCRSGWSALLLQQGVLQQHQLTLASEQNRIGALDERAGLVREQYAALLRELDRINLAVHASPLAERSHAPPLQPWAAAATEAAAAAPWGAAPAPASGGLAEPAGPRAAPAGGAAAARPPPGGGREPQEAGRFGRCATTGMRPDPGTDAINLAI
ncbi:unnamed protein product [Prorocentrum cordatum]|uniref:Uncharacterized protein n=1 Tax=Prorocentrum cordatum TaxID=2364126 RepID=A0ABN9VZR4_9DINO|nr:unnamed protein product [Polarella glacialis]